MLSETLSLLILSLSVPVDVTERDFATVSALDSQATMTKTTVCYLASTPVTFTPVVTWSKTDTGTSGSTSAGLLWPPTGGL